MISARDASGPLRDRVCSEFGVRHAFLTSTGRAGMTVLLRAMRRLAPTHRDEVVLPSYTCYSVAASVVKAGLRPRIVDVSPDTLDYAPDALAETDFSRVLALVASNLYGLPNDLPALSRLAGDRGIFLIDDAAQAMGASIGGKWSGSWGDAGLFSFDKGKNVSAIDGGVLVTSSDALADMIRAEQAELSSPGAATSVAHVLKTLAYFAMLRPWLYGIPTRIPQLGLGKTAFTTDFPLNQADPALVALGLTMLPRLDEFTRRRVDNATRLLDGLGSLGDVQTVTPLPESSPVYLRLPILMPTPRARDHVLGALNAAGIGATGSYPRSIADVPELAARLANPGDCATGGRRVASCVVTLPTHPFVTRDDITRMTTIIAETCAASEADHAPGAGPGDRNSSRGDVARSLAN